MRPATGGLPTSCNNGSTDPGVPNLIQVICSGFRFGAAPLAILNRQVALHILAIDLGRSAAEWRTVTVETPPLINAANYRITVNLSGAAAIGGVALR